MENIDDFMQRKFDSDDPAERFPFREEYWEQAQALIEADEQRRRKRRRFLFWWFFSGLFVGAGVLWLWLGQPGQASEMASGKDMEQQEVVSPAAPAEKNTLSDREHSTATTTPRQTDTASEQGSEHSLKSIDNQQSRAGEGKAQAESAPKKPGATPSVTTLRGARTPAVAPSISSRKARSDRKTNGTGKSTPSSDRPSENNIPAPEKTTNQNEDIKQPQSVSPDKSMPAQLNAPVSTTDAIQAAGFVPTDNIALLEVLELPFPPVLRAEKNLVFYKKPKQYAAQIKPVSDKRFVLGAAASVSTWKSGTGYTAGLFGNYRLNAPWSVSAGLRLRYLPLAAANPLPDSSEQVSVRYRYSFGFERTEWRRTAVGLHYLEIPLAARWQRGRLGLEAGVAPGILLLARDQVTQTIESSLGGIETPVKRFESGEKTNFRSAYFSTFVLAEWRVVSRLGLTLRGNYRPGSILKPVENIEFEKFALGLDMGLRWRF